MPRSRVRGARRLFRPSIIAPNCARNRGASRRNQGAKESMKPIAILRGAVVLFTGLLGCAAASSGHLKGPASPIFEVSVPPGYREWRLISVAHEEGDLKDLRAVLGNDKAIDAYR